MVFGIVCAMNQEIAQLSEDIANKKVQIIGNREYIEGTLYGKEVVLVLSRIGKVASASTVTTLIDKYDVSSVVFTGVAGGAADNADIGDVVISTELLQHDLDVTPIGFRKWEVPLLDVVKISSDTYLTELAFNAASEFINNHRNEHIKEETFVEFNVLSPKVIKGIIASGDQFIADTDKINSLAAEIEGLSCIEMEGAAVAQVCYEHNVPFVVIRTISDKADHSATVDFPKFIDSLARYFSAGIIKKMFEVVQ